MDGSPSSAGFDNSKNPIFKPISGDDITQLYDTRKLSLGIQRHLLVIFSCMVLGTILGGYIAYHQLTHFTADAVVLYKEDLPKTLPGGVTLNNPTLNTAVDLIALDANFQAIIGQLGLNLNYKQLAGMIDVPKPFNNSHLVHIFAKSNNPNLAVDIANALAKIAVKRSQDFYSQQLQAELNNFKSQLNQVNQKLSQELKDIESFKKEHQYFEMTADYVTLINQLTSARNKLQSANLRFNSLYVEYENLKKATANLPEHIESQETFRETRGSNNNQMTVGSLQQSLREARAKYSSENPKVKILEDELKDALNHENKASNKDDSSSEPFYQKNPSKERLDFELIRMESKVRSAQKMKEDLAILLAKIEKNLGTLPTEQMIFAKLLRAKQISEGQVDFLNKAIETLQLMLNVPTGSFELYQLAEKAKPLSESILVKGLPFIGLIFGACLGIFASIYLEMRDKKYRTLKQIEMAYHVPPLLLIPEFSFFTKKNSKDKTLYFIRNLAERLEQLSTKSNLKNKEAPNNLAVSFTSSINREGKSCLSYHLALYYHQIGKKVILLEMDTEHNPFSGNATFIPLENYLENKVNLEQIFFKKPMDCIKVGQKNLFMKELIKSPQMIQLMDKIKREYEVIIMDAPGVIETDYTVNLIAMTDLKLFVINSSLVNKKTVNESLRDLCIAGINPTGIILNRVSSIYIEDRRIKLEMQKFKMHFWKKIFRR
jgi:uncharacterized protein involved in exopolysaccharide biosynthesis/Mrp family chromosome partitioning ATPase